MALLFACDSHSELVPISFAQPGDIYTCDECHKTVQCRSRKNTKWYQHSPDPTQKCRLKIQGHVTKSKIKESYLSYLIKRDKKINVEASVFTYYCLPLNSANSHYIRTLAEKTETKEIIEKDEITDDLEITYKSLIENVKIYSTKDHIKYKIENTNIAIEESQIVRLTDYEQLFRNIVLSIRHPLKTGLGYFKNKIRSLIYHWGQELIGFDDDDDMINEDTLCALTGVTKNQKFYKERFRPFIHLLKPAFFNFTELNISIDDISTLPNRDELLNAVIAKVDNVIYVKKRDDYGHMQYVPLNTIFGDVEEIDKNNNLMRLVLSLLERDTINCDKYITKTGTYIKGKYKAFTDEKDFIEYRNDNIKRCVNSLRKEHKHWVIKNDCIEKLLNDLYSHPICHYCKDNNKCELLECNYSDVRDEYNYFFDEFNDGLYPNITKWMPPLICPRFRILGHVLKNLEDFYKKSELNAAINFLRVCSMVRIAAGYPNQSMNYVFERNPEYFKAYCHYEDLFYVSFGINRLLQSILNISLSNNIYRFNTFHDFKTNKYTLSRKLYNGQYKVEIDEDLYYEFMNKINHRDFIDTLSYLMNNTNYEIKKVYYGDINTIVNMRYLLKTLFNEPNLLKIITVEETKVLSRMDHLVPITINVGKLTEEEIVAIQHGLRNHTKSESFSLKHYYDKEKDKLLEIFRDSIPRTKTIEHYVNNPKYSKFRVNEHGENVRRQFCYLLWCMSEHSRGIPICKLGKTTDVATRMRIANYRNAKIFKIIEVFDCDVCEDELIGRFSDKYGRINQSKETNYGLEYFEGDMNDMYETFRIICSKYEMKK